MIQKEVRTKRLVLRALCASDYHQWYKTWTEHRPARNRWDQGSKLKSQCGKARFKKIVSHCSEGAKEDDFYWYGVFEKKSGRLIGSIDFNIFVRETHQFANFGYAIYNRFQGQGYGQEAAQAGLKIGFKDLKLNRLEAAINLDNRKSIRLAESIGMREEGIKKRYWFEFGKWVNHLIYVANPEDVKLKPTKPF